MPGQPFDCLRPKQLGRVLQRHGHPGCPALHAHGQVELRDRRLEALRPHLHLPQALRAGFRIHQQKHRAKQRIAAEIPRHRKLLHQVLERIALMLHPRHHQAFHFLEVVPHHLRLPGLAAQSQRVHEDPQHLLQVRMVPPHHWCPHHDVLLPAVFGQQHLVGRQEEHVQGHPFPLAELARLRAQGLVQAMGLPRPREALQRRPRIIRRQVQDRHLSLELFQPVLRLSLSVLPRQPFLLPHRVVLVLHRQFLQLPAGVRLRKIPDQ